MTIDIVGIVRSSNAKLGRRRNAGIIYDVYGTGAAKNRSRHAAAPKITDRPHAGGGFQNTLKRGTADFYSPAQEARYKKRRTDWPELAVATPLALCT